MNEEPERLQKKIANAGVTSRRKAEDLIRTGHVTVNGKVVTEMGVKVDSHDHVEVDGVPLTPERKVYYLFNKPRQVISAVSDNKGRKVVTDYFKDIPERIYPIGRLDYDTDGVLLLTDDGEFANLLMHPRYELEKTYVAKVKGIPDGAAIKTLQNGVELDKRKTAPAKVKVLSTDHAKKTAIVQITIHEGMNHQVKKMFAKVGSQVEKLKREQYGFLRVDNLASGKYRKLKPQEIAELRKLANGKHYR
ncbi:ribosomal large subunit pseudouridine synthase B [Lactobacillus selangorensis]|uniref:Pseudouridine synthase n=1 Tax=Lactobacillus selangorensis TaxID=81857 RepID=A0A0R2FVY7_9LACO|nr:pseudouridine synthase [Lactobacillus selangorensis]KRN29436.1 ribosomal large subunit pseudouridine synthase B [Lactobacillus selangorensis]KRN34035.1 ribosomal large subunit pseudouridine synthase B [Lactobacillus selangorensis]